MKGQAKRFLDHKGNPYDNEISLPTPAKPRQRDLGFLDLWRYSTCVERASTVCGACLGVVAALGLVAAVLAYGELTSLFVARHTASETPPYARLLTAFGGGRRVPRGDRPAHMQALKEDSVAFGVASLAIMAVQLTAAAAAVTLANWAAGAAVARLRGRLLRALLRQEMAFFDTNTSVNFATILTGDMEALREGIGEHVAMTAYLSGTVVCGSTLALCYGWQLTLAGLAVVPVSIGVAALVARRQTAWAGEETRAYGVAGRVAEQALAAPRTVRAFAGEEEEARRYAVALGGAARATRARAAWAGAGSGLGWLLTYSLNAVVFVYGAALCVRDRDLPPDQQEYHPGVMVTVLFCTFMAAQNVTMCHPHLEVFSTARGAAKSIFEVLERKSKIDALASAGEGERSDLKVRGEVTFENVYFNYPARPDVKVLRGLSLKVRQGETVALVGSSGCGKSTVLQLLQRLYEPDAGVVSVDGRQLDTLPLLAYRTSIGVVGQEPVLFSGTIRENITLGLEGVTDEDVIAAAETAHAHQFIGKLPQGYSTMLGSNGAELSGGQKQRVAIARAVLRRPALLLLDEPTSALDPASERVVQAALDAAAVGRTTLVVSHRLQTVVNATRIVYMEQGSVLEQGSHAELLAARGAYYRLVQEDLAGGAPTGATAAIDEADDMPPSPTPALRRAISRQSSTFVRASMGGAVRSSRRMAAGPDLLPAPVAAVEEDEEEAKEPGAGSWQLLRLQAPEWPLLAGGGVAAFLVGTTMPAFAFLFSKLYGMFAWPDGEEILAASRFYGGLFLGVAALCGCVTFLQAWLFNRAGARFTDRLRLTTFSHYLQQEQAWFDSPANSVGALCARLAADCAAVQGATGTRLGTVLQGVSTMVIGVALAMVFSWKMTLVSLLSVPCVIGGIYLEGYVNKRTEERQRRALEAASRLATEAALNVRTVQSLGVEAAMLERYAGAMRGASGGGGGAVRGPVYGLCLCAPTLGYTVSLAYGGYLIATEDLPYEYAILVSEALIYGAWMLAEALSFAPSFAAARRSGARILAALSRTPRVATEPTASELPGWSATGEVELDEVTFRYPGRSKPALAGLTLRAAPGETLALVGGSGCGKSTVLNLLLRNYDPAGGCVRLDGHDTRRALSTRQLRAQLGLVQQEPVLFERSIRENIAYGDTSRAVPLEEVIQVAKQANIHNFIVGLPEGYETVVGGSGGGGAALSGGQKQRVCIARALVRRPRVLLLDEATSALDAAGERAVAGALEAAARGRTTLVIAHRLATVRHAHCIAVLADGRLREQGTHDALLARRGLYHRLWLQQHPPPP